METIRAIFHHSRVSSFIHLILGTISVHLDTPVAHLLVHGIPTSHAQASIATALTTFNPGLALTTQPRWLTSETSRAGKSASTLAITITGPKAPEPVGKRLVTFSTTYRTERALCFNSATQCANCHGFSHHNNKGTAQVTFRWCALPHTTGEHTCPTATCRMRGRHCNHPILRCVNCTGPHDAHHLFCPSRPKADREGLSGGNEEEMIDT